MMGRTLEFRAWIESTQEMILPDYDGDEYMLVIKDGNVVVLETHFDDYSGYAPAVAAIMQFTGLKTNDGVKVYEGDIVSGGGNIGVIIWDQDRASFVCKLRDGAGGVYVQQMDVIGNIHENPELMEEEE